MVRFSNNSDCDDHENPATMILTIVGDRRARRRKREEVIIMIRNTLYGAQEH